MTSLEKTFGLSVLFKLMKQEDNDIIVTEYDNKLHINKSLRELDKTCRKVLKKNNIMLMVR